MNELTIEYDYKLEQLVLIVILWSIKLQDAATVFFMALS